MNETFVGRAAAYYAGKLRAHGPTHRGVDWNSMESQELRFRQLLRICDGEPRLDVNDYGCGYGALVDYLAADGRALEYAGYDAAPEMVEAARARHAATPDCSFTSNRADLAPRACTIASGIFNVKFDADRDAWWEYIAAELDDIAAVSVKGFAFNLLTAYSDPDRRRDDLFYAEPETVLRHCLTRYSHTVALNHDYPLYEFTVLVRL
jgi:SAM-dependent methyltransferase